MMILVLLWIGFVGVHGAEKLFAVLGGSQCAENLYYGSQSISSSGSSDGQHAYFLSTNPTGMENAHDEWVQMVTKGSQELFRISWSFFTSKTLSQRFADAVSQGETVTYNIVDSQNGAEYTYYGTWRFSTASGDMTSLFANSTTQCCFSADGGAWGGGSGTIDGNAQMISTFWGIGNFDSSSDSACTNAYKNGVLHTSGVKVTMSYIVPDRLSVHVYQIFDGVNMAEYLTQRTLHDEVILRATIAYLPGAALSNVRSFYADNANPHIYDINAQFILVLEGTDMTYRDAQQQLMSAFETGAFDLTLRSTAVQYGAPGLSNANCTEMFTTDISNYYSDDEAEKELLSISAIIGIAVGGAAFLCIVMSMCVWWCRRTPHSTSTSVASIGAQQKETSAGPACVDDPNQYFYGRVAAADPVKAKHEKEMELAPSAPLGAVAMTVRPDAQTLYYSGMPVAAEVVPYTQLYEEHTSV